MDRQCCQNKPRAFDQAAGAFVGPLVRCDGEVTDRLAATGTMGCLVMCETCWLAYHARLLPAGAPLTFENVLPLAVASSGAWDRSALGYGEDHDDDARRHYDELPDGCVEAAKLAAELARRVEDGD